MHFIILILVFKIALTVLMVTLGAMFMVEFFPMMADKAVAATNGTMLEAVGQAVAVGLNFAAKYAQIFIDIVFSWLRAIGIDIDPHFMKESMGDVDLEAPKNIEKPKF